MSQPDERRGRFRVESALLCDEIRREDNGKLFVIGVYAANILFAEWPAATVVSILVIANCPEIGEFSLEFKIKFNDRPIWESKNGKVNARDIGKTLIPIRNLVLEADKPGTLTLEANELGRGWELIMSIPVDRIETKARDDSSTVQLH